MSPNPTPPTVSLQDPGLQQVLLKRPFIAGGSEQTTTGSQSVALVIDNQSASKLAVTPAFLAQVDVPGPLTVKFFGDPTVTGGTTRAAMSNYIGANPGIAEAVIKTGVNILSGGTEFSPQVFVHENAPFLYEGLPIAIEPGHSAAMQVTGQSLTTINYRLNATWLELPT